LAGEQGIALIVTLMVMSLMLALSLALTLTTITESRIAAGYRRSVEARYAVDAAIARVVPELAGLSRWDDVLTGAVKSAFVDGAASGERTLPGGGRVDLTAATNLVRCGRHTCSQADLTANTGDRPWGMNNPMWQPYAYGPIDRLAMSAGDLESPIYAMVWVADDPSETDDDPLHDGGPPPGCDPNADASCADRNPGRGIILVLARAFGPDGTQRGAAVTLMRDDGADGPAADAGSDARVVTWRDVP
jgi:hypothetical protein